MYFCFCFVCKLFCLNWISVFQINYISVLCWFFVGNNVDIVIGLKINKITKQYETNDWKVRQKNFQLESKRKKYDLVEKFPSQLNTVHVIDIDHYSRLWSQLICFGYELSVIFKNRMNLDKLIVFLAASARSRMPVLAICLLTAG